MEFKKFSIILIMVFVPVSKIGAHPSELIFPYSEAKSISLSREAIGALTNSRCKSIMGHNRALTQVDSRTVKRLLRDDKRKLGLFLAEMDVKTKIINRKMVTTRAPKYAINAHPFVNTCGGSSIKPMGAVAIYSAFLACPSLRAEFDTPQLRRDIHSMIHLERDVARMITKSDNSATRRVFSTLKKIQNKCSITGASTEKTWGLHNVIAERLGIFSVTQGGTFACGTIYENCQSFNHNSFPNIPRKKKSMGHIGSQFITIDSQAKFYLAAVNKDLFGDLGTPKDREMYSQRFLNELRMPVNLDQFDDYFKRAGNKAMPPSYGSPCAFLKQQSIKPNGVKPFPNRCFSYKSINSIGSPVKNLYRKTGSRIRLCANDLAYIQLEDGSEYMMGAFVNLKGDPAMNENKNYDLNKKIFHDLRLILGAIKSGVSPICPHRVRARTKSKADF